MFLGFGLTDYIFNSPKQIILFMILIGLTQAISRCYEENEPVQIEIRQQEPNNTNERIEMLT